MTARKFILTINNPDGLFDGSDFPWLKYALWQLEMGESGTPHYQMVRAFH